jgi:hypothetical protein
MSKIAEAFYRIVDPASVLFNPWNRLESGEKLGHTSIPF